MPNSVGGKIQTVLSNLMKLHLERSKVGAARQRAAHVTAHVFYGDAAPSIAGRYIPYQRYTLCTLCGC
jgi:hypothetical protein